MTHYLPTNRVSGETGAVQSCGIRTGGEVVCWGANTYGQVTVPSGLFTAIAAGHGHSCGIRTGGEVVCWGFNRRGQATAPSGLFTAIAAGHGYSCGMRTGGEVVCWGANYNGQVTAPSGLFTAIAAGHGYSCGMRTGGEVVCWGNTGGGEAASGAFTADAVGVGHSCGMRTGGQVACWGNTGGGQTAAPSGSFTAIAAGWLYSCGIRRGGSVVCWGWLATVFPALGPVVGAGSGSAEDAGVHQPAVDALRARYEGIFDGTGCVDQTGLCPAEPLQRWEMAVWLIRVLDQNEPVPPAQTRFDDIGGDPWWAAHTERLAEVGVTTGCATGPLRYCPQKPVTRAQMATFLARATGAITEPVTTDHTPELNEISGCGYGSDPVPSLDFDRDGEPDPDEYACVTRRECGRVNASFIPDTVLTQEQLGQIIVTSPMWCRGDPEIDWDPWFEANPWAKPYRDPQPK